jgi:hypothetical protein
MMKRNMIVLSIFLAAIIPISVFAASNNPIHLEWAPPNPPGNTVVTVHQGWNLVPLPLLYGISGRYWSTFRAGQTTCDQDVARDVWMWSPVQNKYINFVMDDWGAPAERDNQALVNEYNSKSFSVFFGSGWIYSNKDCVMTHDNTGSPNMAAQYRACPDIINTPEPILCYDQYTDLTLKKGWNFVAVDFWMAYNKTFSYAFGNCQISQVNAWDPVTQNWVVTSAAQMTTTAQQLKDSDNVMTIDDFYMRTWLMKVDNDCKISMTGSTAGGPPPIPE